MSPDPDEKREGVGSSGSFEKNDGTNETKDEREETEEEYRQRVYGSSITDIYRESGDETVGDQLLDSETSSRREMPRSTPSLRRRLSQRMSEELVRRRSSVTEQLPKTPQGWVIFCSAIASMILAHEIRLQRHLTGPPLVYGQVHDEPLASIYARLSEEETSILRRNISPSLFVGTRGLVASTAAYLLGGPALSQRHIRFRQILTMTQDGAKVAVDWELPTAVNNAGSSTQDVDRQTQQIINGPIEQPVILILHGINNDASFGYMTSLMRACTKRGWIAAGLNFRGCGGVPLATPRSYNGAYTGDLRCVVQTIAARLARNVPIFVIGNSLGANLVAKYLGEEGLSETLPDCVAGGITLGNPMVMDSQNIDWIFSPLMAMGAKKTLLENWSSFRHMTDPLSRSAIRRALCAVTLADFDHALAPIFARNSILYPFALRPGYKNGTEYWHEGSSFRLVRYISVPLLQLIAGDDFLVYQPFRGRLAYSVANPNILVVETKCGGHLGWQEAPPDGFFSLGGYTSWSDVATTDFIHAVIDTWWAKKNRRAEATPPNGGVPFERSAPPPTRSKL